MRQFFLGFYGANPYNVHMHPFLKLGMDVALCLIIVPLVVVFAFLVDTSVFGHVEGFRGIFIGCPLGFVLALLYFVYAVRKFSKATQPSKPQLNQ